ncbi:MAG: hypothetical protein WA807_06855 [Steroidobacteraceae bacterium]
MTVSAVSQADNAAKASTTLTILARHSVAVRPTASGIAEFFEVASGDVFAPRGNNYIRLAEQTNPFGQEFYHSTFNVGMYDSARVESALASMQGYGYIFVRVFLNTCCNDGIGNVNGAGLSSSYMANVADFLNRAANHSIQVMLTWEWLPDYGGYSIGGCAADPSQAAFNALNLCPGGVSGSVHFAHDIVQALIDQGARLDAVFAFEIRNEYSYDTSLPPLSWTTGTFTAADGQTYDMSSSASRQQMMDNGLIYYTNQVRGAIVALDPTALVDVGFFVPQTPNPTRIGDTRVIEIYPAMANSTADFVALHPYPIPSGLTMSQYVQNFGFVGYQQQKPVVMGEFGAGEADYPVIAQAASVLQDWQVQSCAYSFKGWSLWTWDTDETEPGTPNPNPNWTALSGNGEINSALAPSVRPDPCQ